jgi:hypothetical protein
MSETETPVAERSLPDWLADDDDDAVTETAPDNADAAPSTEDSAEDESAQPSAQPRDPVTGKFAPKAEAPEAAAAPVAETLPAQPVVAPVSDAVPAQPATPSAFTYKAGGREYTIPGLAVPPEHEAEVRALLSEGMHHRTSWRQREQQLRQTVESERQQLTQEKARLDAINSELVRLMADPDAFAEFYQNFERDAPALQARAEKAQLEAKLKAYESERETEFQTQAEKAASDSLEQQVREAATRDYAGIFTDGDVAKLIGDLQGTVVVADRDYPEYGYQKGDILVDERKLLGHLAYEADQRRKAKATQAEALKRVEKVAQANAATLAPSSVPPVVSARSTPAPQATKKKPTTRKEWLNALDEDDD